MLYLVGVGLSSFKDLSLNAIDVLNQCDYVYLESYTSFLIDSDQGLENIIDKTPILADRDLVEQGVEILKRAKSFNVALLVVGDPLSATTHTGNIYYMPIDVHIDIIQRAMYDGIPYKVISNTSIMNAVGCCGLFLYDFGRTISIPFWNELEKPDSFYDKIHHNLMLGMHSLCLLDIKVKEQSIENLLRNIKKYEPSRYMVVGQAANQLVDIAEFRKKSGRKVPIDGNTLAIGMARVGSETQTIAIASLKNWDIAQKKLTCELNSHIGKPLHCMIIIGRMQAMEREFITSSILHSIDEQKGAPVFFFDVNRRAYPKDINEVNKIMSEYAEEVDALIEIR